MARTKGSFGLAGALEIKADAPVDARTKVKTKAELLASGSFPYKYIGMSVFVEAELKRYTLIGTDTTQETNWREDGTGGSSGGDGGTMLTGTMTAAGWTDNAQTVTVTGLNADSIGAIGLLNTATAAQIEAARDAVITVTGLAANAVTFACENVPSVDIPFGVLLGGGGSNGSGVPDGGTTGQVLTKLSDDDGDADWQTPASVEVDDALDATSENPVQNKVVKEALDGKAETTAIAPAFDATKAYAVGDTVSYQGKVYTFNTAHSAGDWNAEHVDETDVTEMTAELTATELQAVKDAFDATTLQSGQFAGTYDVIDLRGTERIVGKVIEADGTEKVLYEKTVNIDSYTTGNIADGTTFVISGMNSTLGIGIIADSKLIRNDGTYAPVVSYVNGNDVNLISGAGSMSYSSSKIRYLFLRYTKTT